MDVQGNGISIDDGDARHQPMIPNFGRPICLRTVAKTFTIRNTGTSSLALTGSSPLCDHRRPTRPIQCFGYPSRHSGKRFHHFPGYIQSRRRRLRSQTSPSPRRCDETLQFSPSRQRLWSSIVVTTAASGITPAAPPSTDGQTANNTVRHRSTSIWADCRLRYNVTAAQSPVSRYCTINVSRHHRLLPNSSTIPVVGKTLAYGLRST